MSITRGSMRSKIQLRIADTSFYSTTFYNDIIDSRVLTWGGYIARLMPNYYIEQTSYTGRDDATDVNYEFYQVPEAFRAFIKLERQFGTGLGRMYQTLRLVNAEEQERYRLQNITLLALPDSLTNYEQTVSLWDDQFRVVPAPPNNSYIYFMKYIRKPIAASADESLLDIPDEWGEVIILDSAIHILSQIGDPMVSGLMPLLQTEVKMLRDEFRRRIMMTEGIPQLGRLDR